MKFPHNTDAWAYHLAALAKCADQSDYRAMLSRERFSKTREARVAGHKCRAYLPMSAALIESATGVSLREAYEKGMIL